MGIVSGGKAFANKIQKVSAVHKQLKYYDEQKDQVFQSQAGVSRTMWQVLEQYDEIDEQAKKYQIGLTLNTCKAVSSKVLQVCGNSVSLLTQGASKVFKAGAGIGASNDAYFGEAEELDLDNTDLNLVTKENEDEIMKKSPISVTNVFSAARKLLMQETEDLGNTIEKNGKQAGDEDLFHDNGYI